jgi:hypothetical protein
VTVEECYTAYPAWKGSMEDMRPRKCRSKFDKLLVPRMANKKQRVGAIASRPKGL